MAKKSQREPETVTSKEIQEVSVLLENYARRFAQYAKDIEGFGGQIVVRSVRTLRLGLENVHIGVIRTNEAIEECRFKQATILTPKELDQENDQLSEHKGSQLKVADSKSSYKKQTDKKSIDDEAKELAEDIADQARRLSNKKKQTKKTTSNKKRSG